jgi:uncharacterized repeat protein (TIGR03837 family)
VTRRCDIFCRVVDNYGDIGVCWRLARQLGTEHGWNVRLFVDDLTSFARIAPEVQPDKPQQRCGLTDIFAWNTASIKDFDPEIDLVIEAFACELPDWYVAAMADVAQRTRAPAWINLEYLSAEPWIDAHHLLPSPHPKFGLTKYFFFPGFTLSSGGLLRERHILPPLPNLRQANGAGALVAYVFGYPAPRTAALVEALLQAPHFQSVSVAEGTLPASTQLCTRYPNKLLARAFVPQPAFDEVLRSADFLVVRGEDSFVRAQWAGRPFVWQIYPQADDAHLVKLRAFLDRYCAGLSPEAATALRMLWEALSDSPREPSAAAFMPMLSALDAVWAELEAHAVRWAQDLMAQSDLSKRLVAWLESERKNP